MTTSIHIFYNLLSTIIQSFDIKRRNLLADYKHQASRYATCFVWRWNTASYYTRREYVCITQCITQSTQDSTWTHRGWHIQTIQEFRTKWQKELPGFSRAPRVFGLLASKRLQWAVNIAGTVKIFVATLLGKQHLGKPKAIWWGNV